VGATRPSANPANATAGAIRRRHVSGTQGRRAPELPRRLPFASSSRWSSSQRSCRLLALQDAQNDWWAVGIKQAFDAKVAQATLLLNQRNYADASNLYIEAIKLLPTDPSIPLVQIQAKLRQRHARGKQRSRTRNTFDAVAAFGHCKELLYYRARCGQACSGCWPQRGGQILYTLHMRPQAAFVALDHVHLAVLRGGGHGRHLTCANQTRKKLFARTRSLLEHADKDDDLTAMSTVS